MKEERLEDNDGSFSVSVYESDTNAPVVLFAVGAGGQPDRYYSFIREMMQSGFTVIAPHFERLVSPRPTVEEMTLRGRRLSLSLDLLSRSDAKVFGVGHSIGATTLVALSGAQLWLGPQLHININTCKRFSRLALLAPPTGFFTAPGALSEISVPMQVWVGSEDKITPPEQSKWLAESLSPKQTVDLRISEGAGHFSFMDLSPPNTIEPLSNKLAFIHECSRGVSKYLIEAE